MDLRFQAKQALAFSTIATELLYGGAAGGGKSHFMRAASIVWCLSIPNLQCYLFRRKSTDLTKNHMEGPTSYPALVADLVADKAVSIVYSPTIQIQFHETGAKIHLCHCQHEKDKYNYQGAEIHVLLIDELTHFTESIYRYLRGRVRMVGVVLPEEFAGMFPRVVSGSNPGGVGHNWVKATFIDISPYQQVTQMEKSEGGLSRQYIPAVLEDNPALMESDPDYESRLEGLGSPELVRAMRNGDWDIVAGGALDDVWSRERHEIDSFDIPVGWHIDRSFDWGSSKPFSVCWWAESDGETLPDGRCWPKGTLFQIGEWYGWNGKVNQGARLSSSEIGRGIKASEKEMDIYGRAMPGPADRSIFDVSPEGESIADKIDRAYGGPCFTPCDKGPGSRVAGLEVLRSRLKAGLSWPMEDMGIFFFSQCRHSIRTLPTLPRDDIKVDDVDTDSEDHVYDSVRYRSSVKKGMRVMEDDKAIRIMQALCRPPKITYSIESLTGAMVAGGKGLSVWDEPQISSGYVIGACLKASNIGSNVAYVCEYPSGRQVAMWREDCTIEEFARILVLIAKRYGNAWIVPERDDLGSALIQSIMQARYMRIYTERLVVPGIGAAEKKPKFGIRGIFLLDSLIEQLAIKVRAGTHGIQEQETAMELSAFRKDEDGKTVIEAGRTCERIIARAMIEHAMRTLPKPRMTAVKSAFSSSPGVASKKPGGGSAWKRGFV